MNKIISKLFLGFFLIFFMGSVFATHEQTSEVTPTLVAGSTPTVFTINVAIDADGNSVDTVRIRIPTGASGFSNLTCGSPPTGWSLSSHDDTDCKYTTTTNQILAGNDKNFTVTATSAATSGAYIWSISTTDIADDSYTGTDTTEVDTTPPTTTISGIDISEDTGTSDADFITKTAAQTITATLDANLVVGEILYGSVDAGSTWANITTKVNGTAVSWDGATLSGTSSIRMKVTDSVGNDGAIATQEYVLDTTAPTVEIVVTDTALKIGETSSVTITFSEAVTDFNNDDITAIENGTLTAVATTDNIIFTATLTPAVDVEDTSNVITILKTGLTDVAGNAGVGSTSSNAYAIDTLAPTTTISGIDISEDTGTSATDFITKTAVQTITATLDANLVVGEILYGSVDAGSNWIDITNKVTETAVNWNGATLSGTSSIRMKVTDSAGNDGTIATQEYVLDTAAPTVNAGDDMFTTVQISRTATATETGSGIASHLWTADPVGVTFGSSNELTTTITANVGAYTVTLTVTDIAGNIGTDEFELTYDTMYGFEYLGQSGHGFTAEVEEGWFSEHRFEYMDIWNPDLLVEDFLNSAAGPTDERLVSTDVNTIYIYDATNDLDPWVTVDSSEYSERNFYDLISPVTFIGFHLNKSTAALKSIRHIPKVV